MLEYHAHQNYLVFQNENSHLVTALPYIDEPIDDKYKTKVNDLILKEMRNMTAESKKDYLEKLPMPKLTHLLI